jgi:hypothetical protein
MPDYRTLIGDMVPPPPFQHRGVTLHGMFFDADLQALQGYMGATFNQVPGIRCEVLSGTTMLVTLYAQDVRPLDDRYDQRDGISEIDCGFWTLVRCGRIGGPSRIYWAPLCLFVDSVFALVIGRELYGFPKMLGRITPAAPSAAADLSVALRTDHFQRVGARDKLVRDAPLFAIVRDTSVTASVNEIELDELLVDAFQTIQSQAGLDVFGGTDSDAPGIPYLGMPMLFLRQLRAIRNTPASAYVAAATATMEPTAPPFIERIADDSLKLVISPSQSLPLEKFIGVDSGAKARLPFRARLDFTAGEGRDI